MAKKYKNLMRTKGYQKELIEMIDEGWIRFFSKRPKGDWPWQFRQYMERKENKKNG